MLSECFPKVLWDPSLKVSAVIAMNPSGSRTPWPLRRTFQQRSTGLCIKTVSALRERRQNVSCTVQYQRVCHESRPPGGVKVQVKCWEATNGTWFLTQHLSRRAKFNINFFKAEVERSAAASERFLVLYFCFYRGFTKQLLVTEPQATWHQQSPQVHPAPRFASLLLSLGTRGSLQGQG